jgi:hypothetical protein
VLVTASSTALDSSFGTGQVFGLTLRFFCFSVWTWLLAAICSDIFVSHEMSGWARARWVQM